MTYLSHFQLTDDYIVHLDEILDGVSDPFVKSRYVGFLSISAVTVYELAVKEIIYDFCDKKHKVLSYIGRNHFERINGRIRLEQLKKDYLKFFGNKYLLKFRKIIEDEENAILQAEGKHIRSMYTNIITTRNEFAHGGHIDINATYEETKDQYAYGKKVIECFDKALKR